MPEYPWLIENELDKSLIAKKIRAMRSLGIPYPIDYDKNALKDLETQAEKITAGLKESMIDVQGDREIIALIAYLQRLGTDIRGDKK